MMHVMKFSDACETGFQHLGIRQGGNRFDVLGREPIQEMVHDFPPGPETVGGRAAHLRQTGHAALKRMAVQIGQAGDAHRTSLISRPPRNLGFGLRDDAVRDGQAHVFPPLPGKERGFKPQPHGRTSPTLRIFTRYVHSVWMYYTPGETRGDITNKPWRAGGP